MTTSASTAGPPTVGSARSASEPASASCTRTCCAPGSYGRARRRRTATRRADCCPPRRATDDDDLRPPTRDLRPACRLRRRLRRWRVTDAASGTWGVVKNVSYRSPSARRLTPWLIGRYERMNSLRPPLVSARGRGPRGRLESEPGCRGGRAPRPVGRRDRSPRRKADYGGAVVFRRRERRRHRSAHKVAGVPTMAGKFTLSRARSQARTALRLLLRRVSPTAGPRRLPHGFDLAGGSLTVASRLFVGRPAACEKPTLPPARGRFPVVSSWQQWALRRLGEADALRDARH